MFPDGLHFYPDLKDGKRGYNTDAARGADTFVPFKRGLTFVTGSGVMGYGDKTIVTIEKPKLIIAFTQVSDLMGYANNRPTGVYLTDDDYNVLVWQGSYTIRNVADNSFNIHNTQDDKSYAYIYGY